MSALLLTRIHERAENRAARRMDERDDWTARMCEGETGTFSDDVLKHALDDARLTEILQQIAHPDYRVTERSALVKVRLMRGYLIEAMELAYSEREAPAPDLFDAMNMARSESVDDEIDRRRDDRATGDA